MKELKKICVVEDDINIRAVLIDVIQFINPHTLITEISTTDEFHRLNKDNFDMIFLDCDLHGDRSATCDFLFKNSSIRTILITGDTTVTIPEELRDISSVMYKPFTLTDIEKIIQ